MKSTCCLLAILLAQLSTAGAAHAARCGTPSPSASLAAAMQAIDGSAPNMAAQLNPTDVVIPVQFHIIRRNSGYGDVSDEQIFKQIDVLNERFSLTRFRFTLRGIDRTYNSTWAAAATLSAEYQMKTALAVDVSRTLNVYTCPDYANLGVATFPLDYAETDPMHGVIVQTGTVPGGTAIGFNLGVTLVHEVGHYLGLFHTFQGNSCSGPGDQVSDTPQHSGPNFGMPPDSTDTCPSVSGKDPVHNYMNYVDDIWMTNFTAGQRQRAHAQTAAGRPTLWNTGVSDNTSHLSNISTRLRVEPGGNVAIAGFIITGTGSRPLLVRGMGPWLTNFGLSGLQNPVLSLQTPTGSPVASNDDWRNPASNESAVQATGLAPAYDVEAALRLDLPVGAYTAIMSPKAATADGIGLVEMYDLGSGEQPNRIVNISTRGLVGFGDNAMIAGFIIVGGNKEVLIRGIGPRLADFGIPNALQNPKITLRRLNNGQWTTVGVNYSWTEAGNYNQILEAMSVTWAFGVTSSNEAMMLKVLTPGTYSVITEPESGSGGVGLTEVYDVNAY